MLPVPVNGIIYVTCYASHLQNQCSVITLAFGIWDCLPTRVFYQTPISLPCSATENYIFIFSGFGQSTHFV